MRQPRFRKMGLRAATAPVLLFGGFALACSALSSTRDARPADACAAQAQLATDQCKVLGTARAIEHEVRRIVESASAESVSRWPDKLVGEALQRVAFRGPNPLRIQPHARAAFDARSGSLHMHFAS